MDFFFLRENLKYFELSVAQIPSLDVIDGIVR